MSVMDLVGVPERRFEQMGRAIVSCAVTDGIADVGPVGWTLITGEPSADANMVAVYSDSSTYLSKALAQVEERGCPTLVMFSEAGARLGLTMPAGWSNVGAMPIMAFDVQAAATFLDPRVRRATSADSDAIADLGADAFGMGPEVFRIFTDAAIEGPMRAYVLVDGSSVVSTVVTGHIEDTVSVWCMATPQARQRHGYGRALLSHVLAEAAGAGAKIGLLGATEAGYPLYASTGWETFAQWQVYLNAESAQFS